MADRQKVDPIGRFAPKPLGGVALLLAFASVAYLLATWCGLGQTPDSRHYIATAQHLAQKGEFTSFDGQPYTLWPPLFPLVLSLAPQHALALAKILHLSCLVATLLIWWKVGEGFFQETKWRLFFLFTLASSTPLLMVHVFVWSEPLFIFLFSAYLLCIHYFLERKPGAWLLWATVFAFFMMLQRNAGIMLFAGMNLGLVLFAFQKIRQHWRGFIVHALGSPLGLMGWLGWLYFFERRLESVDNFLFNQVDGAKYQTFWEALVLHLLPWQIPAAPLLFIILAGSVLWLARKAIFPSFQKSIWLMMLLYAFIVVNLPFTLSADAHRYLAVLVPPLFLNFIWMLRQIDQRPQFRLFTFCLLWSLYPLVRVLWNALRWHWAFCGSGGFF